MQGLDFSVLYRKLILPYLISLGKLGLMVAVVFLALLLYSQIKYCLPMPWRLNACKVHRLRRMKINMKIIDFIRWMYVDAIYYEKKRNEFNEYGLTLYCGRQGRGKTISLIHYANWVHFRYPECIIVSNFKYKYADRHMNSWRDFFDIRNGKRGVLFLIDEIHSEWSSKDWKDVPDNFLAEVSQQRKQRIKIAATSQIFTRVVKQLREQTETVVMCSTVANRWTFNKEYDAKDYELSCDSSAESRKLRTVSRSSFVQSDFLRTCYDTYEKIKRLEKKEFTDRHERVSE